jgi:hypothetical protein
MSQRVSALFASRDDAERAAAALMDHGVDREEIAMVARGPAKPGTREAGGGEDPADPGSVTVTSPGDMAAGAAMGAGVGAIVGLLGTMALVLPGIGPLVAAGPLAAALAAGTGLSAAAGAVVGGVYGALVDLGIEETAARRYEAGVVGGLTLLSVRTNALTTGEIEELFAKYNATDITVGLLPDPDPSTPGIGAAAY